MDPFIWVMENKNMVIESIKQVEELKLKMYKSANDTVEQLRTLIETHSALELLFKMKFEKIGYEPIEGTTLNIIEQINQTFSDLVAINALEDLLTRYPEKRFITHLGVEAGFDIEAEDGTVVAECFAVTIASSNGKLKKDSEKLINKAPHQKKYIYFYSQNDTNIKLENVYVKFQDITYKRIEHFDLQI